MTGYAHQPVLVEEVVSAFQPAANGWIVDGTLGLGGHSEALLSRYPSIRVLGIEWDDAARAQAERRLATFGSRFRAVQGSYADARRHIAEQGVSPVSGVLLDLGLSSLQMDDPSRGFSFNAEGALDMRMSPATRWTAWDWLVQNDAETLARIFREYGEEKFARRAAVAVKDAIRLGTVRNQAKQVADVFRAAIPHHGGMIDAATRCFQALRIAVNGELDNVKKILADLPDVIVSGGRAVTIAFHSLEDRLIKRAFQQAARGCVCPPQAPQCTCGQAPWGALITKKPIRPTDDEVRRNPRSRSAVLRILERR